eukprot:COSAG01_NODE_13918_length_1517_cov_256.664316_2_plen_191_part_00
MGCFRLCAQRYDLKGSWVNRSTTADLHHSWVSLRCTDTRSYRVSYQSRGNVWLFAVLRLCCAVLWMHQHLTRKDNDLQEKIYMAEDEWKALDAQLKLDTDFLQEHGIMDYSMLLGIRKGLNRTQLGAPCVTRHSWHRQQCLSQHVPHCAYTCIVLCNVCRLLDPSPQLQVRAPGRLSAAMPTRWQWGGRV